MQAGGDAHLTIHRTGQDRAELIRYLAPILLALLLITTFDEQIELGGRIAIAAAAVVWMAWAAANDTHLRLAQRIALPVIATAYTTTLIVFTVLPDLPAALQIAIPATCWIAAAAITLRITKTDHKHRTITQYAATTVIGVGVALIGGGVTSPRADRAE